MTQLLTISEVAERFRCSEWTIGELVRKKKVSCVRIATGDGDRGPVRFTADQVEQILLHLTVDATTPTTPRRRKRRTPSRSESA